MPLTPLEAFNQIAAEVKDASPERVAAVIEQRFGIKINPKYVSLYRAMLWEPADQVEGSKSEVA